MADTDTAANRVFHLVYGGDKDQVAEAIENYRKPGFGQTDSNLKHLDAIDNYHKLGFGQLASKRKHLDALFNLVSTQKEHSLLHLACLYNTEEVASYLLSLWNQWKCKRDEYGATAVMYAARAGMAGFVKEWIKRGYDVTSTDKKDRNILHYFWAPDSIFYDILDLERKPCNHEIMEELFYLILQKGIDIFQVVSQARDLVRCAIESKYFTIAVHILADKSRARTLWDKRLYRTIALLSQYKIYHRVKLDTKPLPVLGDYIHLCLWECFHQDSTIKKRREIIESFETTIRSARLNVNEPDDNGRTALHHLCYYQFDTEPYGLREGLVAKLLELGADPNLTDIRGCTPLMCAVDRGYVDAEDLNDNQHETGIAKLLKTNQTCEEKATAEGNEKTNKEESELVKEKNPSN